MVVKSKGFRSKTRKKLKKKKRASLTKFLQKFSINEKVLIEPEPSSHKGMPFPRFKGKIGKIVGKRGKAYLVEVKDFKRVKKLIVFPEHLRKI